MSRLIRGVWEARIGGIDIPRRDRKSCVYHAYVPDRLAERLFTLEESVLADAVEAEHAVVRLNQRAQALVDTEALARILLRAESVASSRIEGLAIGARRLLEADVLQHKGVRVGQDITAQEVLQNIESMTAALEAISSEKSITVSHILKAHNILLSGTSLAQYAGRIRVEQNWIGGGFYNPCSAIFIPPPPEYLMDLLEDLCNFCNDDRLPPLIQAAIAHAQFETIHPFVDGNGRIGRILIHMILKRRQIAPRVVPPISLILATRADAYMAALQATRYRGSSSSKEAGESIHAWIAEFATATRRAVTDADAFEANIDRLQKEWKIRLGGMRSDATALQLLRKLPGAPVITVTTASALVGKKSFTVTNDAIAQLVNAGILKERKKQQRNRIFEAHEIIELFTDLERRLASPAGNTRLQPPVRAVPFRKKRNDSQAR